MFLHVFLTLCTRVLIILIIREVILMIMRTIFLKKEVKNLKGKVSLVYALLSTKEFFKSSENVKNIFVPGSGMYAVYLNEKCLRIDETVINLKKDLVSQLLPLVKPVFEKIEEDATYGIFLKRDLIRSCQAIEKIIQDLPQMIEEETQKGELL